MPLKTLIAILLLGLSATAQAALCPSTHFEPTTYYGQAFFDSRPVTEHKILRKDEEFALQYIEYQTFETGYEPVFAVSVLHTEAGQYRVALVRAKTPHKKGGAPRVVSTSRQLAPELGERMTAVVASTLLHTRYPEAPCDIGWTDGYVVQVMASQVNGYGNLVGEAYSPQKKSEAAAIVDLGRALRAYVEGSASQAQVEAAAILAEGHNNSFKPKPLRGSA